MAQEQHSAFDVDFDEFLNLGAQLDAQPAQQLPGQDLLLPPLDLTLDAPILFVDAQPEQPERTETETTLQQLMDFESAEHGWAVDPAVFAVKHPLEELWAGQQQETLTEAQNDSVVPALTLDASLAVDVKPEASLSPNDASSSSFASEPYQPSTPPMEKDAEDTKKRARRSNGKKRRRTTADDDASESQDEKAKSEKYSIAHVGTTLEELRSFIDELERDESITPKEKRQIRNKISARNFRVRRKEYVTTLEDEVKQLKDEKDQLAERVVQVEQENAELKEELEQLRTLLAEKLVVTPTAPTEKTTTPVPAPAIPAQPIDTFVSAAPAAAHVPLCRKPTDPTPVSVLSPQLRMSACNISGSTYPSSWNPRLQVHSVVLPPTYPTLSKPSEPLTAKDLLSVSTLLSPSQTRRHRRRRPRASEKLLRAAWESIKLGEVEDEVVKGVLAIAVLAMNGVVRVVV
ncbi:hypothetical protein SpCBS45565_g08510 [Spizellomyces sp. 'palustris']|nr:hypothetical protein SpCBS45565_g08510 [Spizellomyces sp. 'palustris']